MKIFHPILLKGGMSLRIHPLALSHRNALPAQRSRFVSPDGSYHVCRGRREAIWPTAQVLLLQLELNYPPEVIERTARNVLHFQGRIPETIRAAEADDIDVRLPGWTWVRNTFPWVEPTAWACLALCRAAYGEHPRVVEGLHFLLDRAHLEGGTNCGNRRTFNKI